MDIIGEKKVKTTKEYPAISKEFIKLINEIGFDYKKCRDRIGLIHDLLFQGLKLRSEGKIEEAKIPGQRNMKMLKDVERDIYPLFEKMLELGYSRNELMR